MQRILRPIADRKVSRHQVLGAVQHLLTWLSYLRKLAWLLRYVQLTKR
jgi:hypothetical protein